MESGSPTNNETVEAFWKARQPKLEAYLNQNRQGVVEDYLKNSLAYCWFTTEGLSKKVTLHKDIHPQLDFLLVMTFDLLRGLEACQKGILFTIAALGLRSIFEIHCKLKFIVQSSDPKLYASRLTRFSTVEKYLHGLKSKTVPPSLKVDESTLKKECADWIDSKTGKLMKNPNWTAIPGKTLKDMAVETNLEAAYYTVYSIGSKATHGSGLTAHAFSDRNSLNAIAGSKLVSQCAVSGSYYTVESLRLYCQFFGVSCSEDEHIKLTSQLLSLKPYLDTD